MTSAASSAILQTNPNFQQIESCMDFVMSQLVRFEKKNHQNTHHAAHKFYFGFAHFLWFTHSFLVAPLALLLFFHIFVSFEWDTVLKWPCFHAYFWNLISECACAHFEFPYLSTNQIIKMSSHAKKSEHTRTSFQISTHLPYFFLSNWHHFTIIFTKIVPHFYRNKLKNLTMALIFKPSKLNMNAIKKNTKSLTSSKEMWKNAERLRSDSMVKSSKFTVKEWPSSKRPTTSYLSYLTKEFLTYIR